MKSSERGITVDNMSFKFIPSRHFPNYGVRYFGMFDFIRESNIPQLIRRDEISLTRGIHYIGFFLLLLDQKIAFLKCLKRMKGKLTFLSDTRCYKISFKLFSIKGSLFVRGFL